MRIISGKSKGKKIFDPIDINTRPLKDLTKESIFNIITHSNKFNTALEKSNILDLFSGVGSFGLECLSRGSKSVTFVENYSIVLPIIRLNNHSSIFNKFFNPFFVTFEMGISVHDYTTLVISLKNRVVVLVHGGFVVKKKSRAAEDSSESICSISRKRDALVYFRLIIFRKSR